jgi:AcrR family transcriptional regulator
MPMTELLFKEELIEKEIIDVARTLFKKHGFKKTTMGHIAMSLGKAKSSLYYYYPGKEEIFEAVINEEMNELMEQIRHAIDEASSAKEKLIAYCRCRLNKLSQLYNLSEVLRREIADMQCMMTDMKGKFDTSQVALVKEILEEGVRNGEFSKINLDNIELVSYLMVSSFRGLAMPLMVSQHQCPRLDLQIDSIVDIMVEGIGK